MQIRRLLQLLAALTATVAVGTWVATGAHPGWSRNKIPVTIVDEITGIEAIQYRDGFVAGVDALALGLGLSTAFAGASWFAGRRPRRAPAA